MKKTFLQAGFFLLSLSVVLHFARTQAPAATYDSLFALYSHAQAHYDKATQLSKVAHYGPKEERLEKKWNGEALQGFANLYPLIPKRLPQFDSLRFYTAFRIGELQHYFENFSEALTHYGQAIAVKEKSALPDSLFFKPLLYAGIILYNQNRFDTAVRYFKRAEAVQAAYGNRLNEGERLYNLLGVLHYERGNYRQAQNYFQKALALLPPAHPYYKELSVNYKINLAQMHLRLEEYEKANKIYQALLPSGINPNEINHNIGSLNLALGEADKAIAFFRKVHYQNNKTIRLYNGLGRAFFNVERYDSAMFYYQKASQAYSALGANADPVGYGMVLKNTGDYNRHFNKDTAALNDYQKAIHQFYPAYTDGNLRHNPDRFSGVFSYINLFEALNAKAEAWQQIHRRTGLQQAAEEALEVYRSAFVLIGYVERTYDSDEARLFLAKTKYAVHSRPIDIAFELYQHTKDKKFLEDLYAFDQQNKAAVLALNRQLNAAVTEIASPLLQKEQALKKEITRLSLRAAQVGDSVQLSTLNSEIRDREIELGKLQEGDRTDSSLGKNSLPSLADLQTMLDEKTALVSYHLSPGKLTTLVVTKNEVACHQQPVPENFTETVQQEIASLKTTLLKTATVRNPLMAKWLLSHLNLSLLEKLVIIPDDVLAYFPFESLRDEEGKFLIQKASVQYQFSTALLKQNRLDFSGAQTLAFAPFAHQGYGDLSALPASAQEVAATAGKKFFDTAATKANFLRYAGSFAVMHLATHAVANNGADGLAYVVFSPIEKGDNLLYAQEIYNLRLSKTRLVILSACETGAGQLIKGEGVISLSRAFAYAGCPNVITSLWKADDFSTAYLTARIHHYLNEGWPVAEAMRLSKAEYLNDKAINPRLKHPYYWAHLVFVGDYTPQTKTRWPWWAAALLFPLLAFAVIKKSRKRRDVHRTNTGKG